MSSQINALTETDISLRLAKFLDKEIVRRDYDSRYPPEFFNEHPHYAAVLVPILKKDHRWHVLFTRRTSSLPEHSGQVAFPGGRAEPDDDSPEVTALREAHEEINLSPSDVRILGRLREIRTISNYCVMPVVGRILWPYKFQLAREEVSRVFTIPLDWLADLNNREINFRELPSPHSPVPVIYFNRFDDELLWGISAEITLNFLESLHLI